MLTAISRVTLVISFRGFNLGGAHAKFIQLPQCLQYKQIRPSFNIII
jgi:hypothetical protein